MYDITTLKKIFPSFPLVSYTQLAEWKNNHSKAIAAASRMKALDKNASLNIEQTNFLELNAIIMAIKPPASELQPYLIDFYTLLRSPSATPADKDRVLLQATEDWAEYITQRLSEEENPLPLLIRLGSIFDNSIQFSALLIALFQKGLTAQEILESSLLNHFFMSHCDALETVQETYHLLSLFAEKETPAQLEINALLSAVKTHRGFFADEEKESINGDGQLVRVKVPRTDSRGFESYALDGSLSQSPQDLIQIPEVKTLFKFTPTATNWDKLEALFDAALFIAALEASSGNQPNNGEMEDISSIHAQPLATPNVSDQTTLFNEKINALSPEKLSALYTTLVTQVSADKKASLLSKFASALNIANAKNLLSQTSSKTWFLLNAKPALLNEIPEWQEWIDALPITVDSIAPIVSLSEQRVFWAHSFTKLHRKIFHVLCTIPTFSMQSTVESIIHENFIKQMRRYPYMTTWCQEKNQEIIECLKDLIKTPTPLTSEKYILIRDLYQQNASFQRLLQALSPEPLAYAQGNYSLQALIMEELLKIKDTALNLDACLEAIHPTELFASNPEDQQNLKQRTLLECLVISKDKPLITRLSEQLMLEFDQFIGHAEQPSLLAKAFPFACEAMLNGNATLLTYLCKHINPIERDTLLFQLQKKRLKSPLKQYSTNTITILFLPFYSSNTVRLDALTLSKGLNDFTIWESIIENPDLLKAIFDSFTQDADGNKARLKFLDHNVYVDHNYHPAIHLTINRPELFKAILNFYTQDADGNKARLEVLGMRNNLNETVLDAFFKAQGSTFDLDALLEIVNPSNSFIEKPEEQQNQKYLTLLKCLSLTKNQELIALLNQKIIAELDKSVGNADQSNAFAQVFPLACQAKLSGNAALFDYLYTRMDNTERLNALIIKDKNTHRDTAYPNTKSNPELLKIILESFTQDADGNKARFTFITTSNSPIYSSETALQQAAEPETTEKNPELLKAIFSSFTPDADGNATRLAALSIQPYDGLSITTLSTIAREQPESLAIILNSFTRNAAGNAARLAVLKTEFTPDSGRYFSEPTQLILHMAMKEHPELLQAILEAILDSFTSDANGDVYRLQVLKMYDNRFKETTLEELFKIQGETFDIDDCLEAIHPKELFVSNPEEQKNQKRHTLLECLSLTKNQKLIPLLNEKLIAEFASIQDNPKHRSEQKTLLAEIFPIASQSMLNGNTALFDSLLKHIAPAEKDQLLLQFHEKLLKKCFKDYSDITTIMLALLPLYSSNTTRLEALKIKNDNGNTALEEILSKNPTLITVIMDSFTQDAYENNTLLELFKVQGPYGWIALHSTIQNSPELLQTILDAFTHDTDRNNAQLEALKIKDLYGNTTLEHIISNNPELITVILNSFTQDAHKNKALLELFKIQGPYQRMPLYSKIKNNPELLKTVLDAFSHDTDGNNARLEALKIQDGQGRMVLEDIASRPLSFAIVLNSFTRDAHGNNVRLEFLKTQDSFGNTLLHITARQNDESFEAILTSFFQNLSDNNSRLEILRIKNNDGNTALHLVKRNYAAVKALLNLFTQDADGNKARQEILNIQDNQGESILSASAEEPELLAIILNSFTQDADGNKAREEILKTPCKYYSNTRPLLERALTERSWEPGKQTETLKIILHSFTQDADGNKARLTVLKAPYNDYGSSLPFLHMVIREKPESLKTITDSFTQDAAGNKARLELLNMQDKHGNSIISMSEKRQAGSAAKLLNDVMTPNVYTAENHAPCHDTGSSASPINASAKLDNTVKSSLIPKLSTQQLFRNSIARSANFEKLDAFILNLMSIRGQFSAKTHRTTAKQEKPLRLIAEVEAAAQEAQDKVHQNNSSEEQIIGSLVETINRINAQAERAGPLSFAYGKQSRLSTLITAALEKTVVSETSHEKTTSISINHKPTVLSKLGT